MFFDQFFLLILIYFDVLTALGSAVPPTATAATFTPGPPPQANPSVGPGPQSYGGEILIYTIELGYDDPDTTSLFGRYILRSS